MNYTMNLKRKSKFYLYFVPEGLYIKKNWIYFVPEGLYIRKIEFIYFKTAISIYIHSKTLWVFR
jgi:hypothetical protein